MQQTFDFLKELSKNNSREWFHANKPKYHASHEEMIAFADRLLGEMNKHDVIETSSGKKSLNRIYRDIRFKKDKTPYKTHWGGGLYRAGAERRGSYYYHIGLNGSFVMGGFFGPNPQDLLHIRNQLAQYSDPFREVLVSKAFKENFGELLGTQLKTAPRGFEKYHPEIDLLRYKQFMLRKDFSIAEVMDKNFHKTVSDSFRSMRPFLDCMTDMLTTDLNGISLV
ncbi:DUF2461 domain-containing protein [Ekhidna sp.]|uniref:DUF2461 domain-containing protein n=1 Tax=Ekhidna sp. TaxID=2608089 RepID=UPI003299D28A